ncbi:receptor-like protein 12 [Senna tora]|uniref:Receptor-like protein 12 n=1 Tax=Senna tora TaxID=362788 RepID=A0A834TPZ0_9FABA|nr:receptor-like protein 12 [Senna tora]
MLYLLLLYPLFTFSVTNSFSSVQPPLCHEDESSALMQFKQSFVITKSASYSSFSYPKTVSWTLSTDCCSWDGVECDDQTGHVIGLHLNSSQLHGSIASNSSLFHLFHLQRLNLSDNHFNYSQIPSTLAHLSRLTHLDLSNSEFSGEIPEEISQLSKLLTLNLCCNYFPSYTQINLLQLKQQNFRSITQNLTNLEVLYLSYVNISSPIPNTLTNLSSLKVLRLHGTGVYGDFPIGIFHLPNLQILKVGSNQGLSGYLPASIGNLNALQVLGMDHCNFSGSIPSSLGNLSQLQYLELSRNKFHGEIPHSIFSLENLRFLYLCRNSWTGEIDLNMFWNLKSLTDLCLSDISFSLLAKTSSVNASLPKNIRSLYLKYCNIEEFPKLLKDQDQLEILDLSYNKIHDTLPSWMWRKENLWALHISNNFLVGEISPLICNLKSLEFLDLSFNRLSGIMPPCLGVFSENLHTLNLANNKLFGFIPQEFMKGNALQMIDFSHNNLQDQLPKALTNCRMLEYLDVSNNQINDSFPFWLGALPELKVLALRSNKFYGVLSSPRTFTFPKLHIIDLSQNDFSGNLPLELIQNWESMRASNTNKLEYEQCYHYYKDTGKYQSFDNSYSFRIFNKGNLLKSDDHVVPTSATNEDEDSWFPFEFDWKIVVIGYGGGLLFGLAMGSTYNWEKHALLWLIRVHRRVQRRY